MVKLTAPYIAGLLGFREVRKILPEISEFFLRLFEGPFLCRNFEQTETRCTSILSSTTNG